MSIFPNAKVSNELQSGPASQLHGGNRQLQKPQSCCRVGLLQQQRRSSKSEGR